MVASMLSNEINYIVSGLERSGTSVMMQMLHNGGLPIGFDDSRPADEHNPKGYFELAGGKIINRLMDRIFDFEPYKGKIIKITAYGLKFLPEGNYRIIYMMRNIEEVLNSMQKMGATIDREQDRVLFDKLNKFSFDMMEKRGDVEYTTINYGDVIESPQKQIERIGLFLNAAPDIESAITAVDRKLYRNRAEG